MPHETVNITRGEFLSAMSAARRGDRLVYHRGFLPRDRSRSVDHHRIAQVAVAALNAAERGEVHIFQRKLEAATELSAGVYEYIAEKRDTPTRPQEWTGCYAHSKNRKGTV